MFIKTKRVKTQWVEFHSWDYDTNHFGILKIFPKQQLNAGRVQYYYYHNLKTNVKLNFGENTSF